MVKLQLKYGQAQKIQAKKLARNWQDSSGILHHQRLSYNSEIIIIELIKKQYNDIIVDYFGIEKLWKLVARKYY